MVQDVWPSLDTNHTKMSYWQKMFASSQAFPLSSFLMGLQYAKMEGEGLVHFIT